MMIFKNNNGIDYEILKLIPFNTTDKQEYADSWQKYRFALLQQKITPVKSTFVVACMVGENSWSQGYYFYDLEPAKNFLDYLEKEYMAWIKHRLLLK